MAEALAEGVAKRTTREAGEGRVDAGVPSLRAVGRALVVGAGARLGGGCVLGMGAAVLPGRAVGACATVLVASVVYDDVPERAVAAGVPAAPLGASRRTRVA